MSIIRSKPLLNMIWLSGDSIIRLGFGFLISVWLARYMGPNEFGLYNYAIAIIAIFTAVASLGMNGVTVRELVSKPDNSEVIMGSSFLLQISGSILASCLVVIFTLLLRPHEYDVLLVVLIMLPSVLFRSSDIIKYWFESNVTSKYTVIAQNIAFFISCALKIAIILLKGSYLLISLTVSIEALFVAIILFYIYYKKTSKIKWKVDSKECKQLLSQSWPLIFSGLALMLYMRMDQIMIGNLIDNAAVGVYSVAVKMIEVWYFFPIAIVSSFFPKIIKSKEKGEEVYNAKMQLLYDALVIIGLLLAIFITFVSSYIIIFFFGEKYSSSIDVIKIYAWVSIFYFLSSASGRWYINEKLQMFALTRNLLGLLVGAALNYILIPIYGIVGSAYATLIAYFCAAYLFDVSNSKTRISFYQKSKALWIPGAIFRLRKSLLNKGLV